METNIVSGHATKLTQTFVNSAKSDGKARARFWDASVPGLVLIVSETGGKKYCAVYRDIDGRQREPRIGDAKLVTLDQARKAALKILAESQLEGRDPIAEKIASRKLAANRRVRTLEKLWDIYWAQCEQRRSKSRNELEKLYYNTQLKLRFGDTPVSDIEADEVSRALQEISINSGLSAANTTLEVCRQMLNLAVARNWVSINVAGGIRPFPTISRDRVATELELGRIWNALEAVRTKQRTTRTDGETSSLALQLALLTLQRRGEVSGIHWREIDWDGKLWTIPGARTKNKKGAHIVPLSGLALDVLRAAFAGRKDGFAFMGRNSDALDPHVLTRFFTRLLASLEIEDFTVHDLRRTGATMLTSERLGVIGEIISRLLNHSPPGPAITLVYNRNTYLPQKRAALDAWADEVKRLAGRALI